MIIRLVLFVLMATGVAGFGGVVWIASRPAAIAHTAAPPPVQKVAVLVAARNLQAGSLLKPEDIKAESIPRTELTADMKRDGQDNRSALVGAMIRRSLVQGEKLSDADVMTTRDHGFLAAVVRPGMRAISIGVDAVSGTAGLIWPGDRVDVILLQSIADPDLPVGRRVAAETVLSNVRVVAIDKQLVQGAVPGAASDTPVARTVTLEVSAEQAERVAVASRIGHLSLTVRAADASSGPLVVAARQAPVFASDVSHALVGQVKRAKVNSIRVFAGAGKSEEFKF